MTSPASASDHHERLIDSEIVEAVFGMSDTEQDREQLVEMLQNLCTELPNELDALDAAWAAGDGQKGRQCCHRLRGVLGNYGLIGASNLLAKGEMLVPNLMMSAESRRAVRVSVAAGMAELRQRYPFLASVTINLPIPPANA